MSQAEAQCRSDPWLAAIDPDQHLSSALDLQFLAALNGYRSGARSAANKQSDSRALTAAGDASDHRACDCADAASLQSLFPAAAGLNASFLVNFPWRV
jgi:hypothetical protein